MNTKIAVQENNGRGAYLFVVAVMAVMLLVSAVAGILRLNEAVLHIGHTATEKAGSTVAVQANTAPADGDYAFYTERYYEAAAARESAAAVEDIDDFAYYARHFYLTAAPQQKVTAAPTDSIAAFYARPYLATQKVTAAPTDSIAAFYARPYLATAVSAEEATGAGDDYAFYTERYYEAAAARDARLAAESEAEKDYAFYTERYYEAAAARDAVASAASETAR
jgi:hypothetical protein